MYSHKMFIAIVCIGYQLSLVEANLAPLFPVVSKVDWNFNIKFVNVSFEITGDERSYNKSYVFSTVAMRDINDIRILVDYTVRALNGTIQNKIFSRSIEYCQFLRRPNMDRMMKMFYITINRTSKLPNRCPICKDQRSVLRFVPATMPVPSFFPETNFHASVNLYSGLRKEPMLESRWYGGLKKIHA